MATSADHLTNRLARLVEAADAAVVSFATYDPGDEDDRSLPRAMTRLEEALGLLSEEVGEQLLLPLQPIQRCGECGSVSLCECSVSAVLYA